MADLSDDELRESLKAYGENAGPITRTTRSLWEKRLNTLKKAHKRSSSSNNLNFLSSDDSEIENADSKVRKKRTLTRNSTSSLLNFRKSNVSPLENEDNVFKKPSPSHRTHSVSSVEKLRNKNINAKLKHNVGTPRPMAFEVETSDSDLDSGGSQTSIKSLRARRKLHVPEGTVNKSPKQLHRDVNKADFTKELPVYPDYTPLYRDYLKLKHKTDQKEFESNGYLTNAISDGEFHEEKIQGFSTNYSHCVSWMLVLGTVAFFVLIGVLYMSEVQKTAYTANKTYSATKFCSKVEEVQCKPLLSVSRELHNLLSTVAGEYECGTSRITRNRNLTVLEAKMILHKQFSDLMPQDFDYIFNQTLKLIVKNPDWGIKWYSVDDGLQISDALVDQEKPLYDPFSALEATNGAKSLWCRLYLSLRWTAAKLLLLAAVAVLLFLTYICVKILKKRREAQEKEFYELVEKVIDILQEPQAEASQQESNMKYCKPVVNIRDTLIPPKERKEKQWLWDKVVAFIEENESRVTVEYEKIAGEHYKVWRWHPCTTPEVDGGKHGKVWQGQAFNKGRNATYSPTPCLKIRNMFDPEVEYGDHWQVNIKDAILEKCEGNNGVLHIAIDTSTSEGCVYVLCDSTEAAGSAYNALHGWWFDGKLVTVKYLRYERYIERFPESKNCTEPLKPSNNKRMSLSTPFFSSALERS